MDQALPNVFKEIQEKNEEKYLTVQTKKSRFEKIITVIFISLKLKGKYHENLLSFQNPKMFDC